ncbi:MAG: hypothetical protein ACXVXC_17445 [Nocardioidaceae bacterium]
MDLMAFQKLRGGLKANVSPATGETLEAAEARLRTLLTSSVLFGNVEVASTEDSDRLLIAMVNFRPGTSEQLVSEYLRQAWTNELRYLGWDACSFLVEDGHVELQAATLHESASHYITLHIVATAGVFAESEIPSQRVPDPQSSRSLLRRRRRLTGV